jgi:hypothetical protein
MEIIPKSSKAHCKKTCVVRWTIADFPTYVDDQTDGLPRDIFEIDGLKVKFFLRVYFSHDFGYHLIVNDMAGEGPTKVKSKFWLEDSNGEKCAETKGKLFIG